MSTPVDPQLMRVIQLKREAGIKLALWSVAALTLVAAGGATLALVYILGGGEALAVTAGALFAVAFFLIPMGLMAFDMNNPITEYLYQSRQLAELMNRIAWNAQREELKRIQDLLKEENLCVTLCLTPENATTNNRRAKPSPPD